MSYLYPSGYIRPRGNWDNVLRIDDIFDIKTQKELLYCDGLARLIRLLLLRNPPRVVSNSEYLPFVI